MTPFLTSPLLVAAGVTHGFFTREGGVSEGRYGSLNCGPGSKDESAKVVENRRRAAQSLGLAPDRLFTPYQIHSSRTVIAPWMRERPQADAVVANRAGIGCSILTADCAPILMIDPTVGVAAAVHAGWKGALGGVIESALQTMTNSGARLERILAAVGPVIGPRSYEVGGDFERQFLADDPMSAPRFGPAPAVHKRLFDLPHYVLDRLGRGGVRQSEWIGRDTFAEPQSFFSYRRAVLEGGAETGRLISIIAVDR